MDNLQKELDIVRKSLRTFVDESEEEYRRAERGERTGKDIELLADAHLAFRAWAVEWLEGNEA
jgi:hypothetical protein